MNRSATVLDQRAATGRANLARLAPRAAFLVLLLAAALMPHIGNSFWTYPKVSRIWATLPFCGLFLLALADLRRPLRLLNLDLLMLLAFLVAPGAWSDTSPLPLVFLYGPLIYLAARMSAVAGLWSAGGQAATAPPHAGGRAIPSSWLLAGIVALLALHTVWALGSPIQSDIGEAGVLGAQSLLHGRPLYGANPAQLASLGYDPHLDTYGPLNYAAYLPFTLIASARTAAELAALFFNLLVAGLLFLLARRLRGSAAAITLAFAWLAFPIGLYAEELGSNDALLAAALLLVLLAGHSPARRGGALALAAWAKLTPLALLPLAIGHDACGPPRRRTAIAFCLGFLLVSIAAFAPVLGDGGATQFIPRTFGFQLGRVPSDSIWAYPARSSEAVRLLAGALHGLLIAGLGAAAATLLWRPRRRDAVGLAAGSAAVLCAMQVCMGYYSFSYILWFAPLVLVALTLGGPQRNEPAGHQGEEAAAHRAFVDRRRRAVTAEHAHAAEGEFARPPRRDSRDRHRSPSGAG